ncbi:ABC transporter permease [Candidatus Pacearchaeota archaeon]|nr:ABC transporter permease [Candidatus Pacearchaeota archaeon]
MGLPKKLEPSFILAKANFKSRVEGSYLGVLWYLLNPLIMFFFLYSIFSTRLGNSIENYAAYLLIGIVLFNFFQAVTMESCRCLILNANIIKSLKFRRSCFIEAIVIKNVYSHIFEIILVFIILVIFKQNTVAFLFYPVLFILFIFFVYGVSLFLSAVTVYIVDLENIWSFATKILFFVTPIFYSIGPQNKLAWVNSLNPLYYFIELFRQVVVYGKLPALSIILFCLCSSIIFLIVGLILFKKLNRRLPELI